MKHTFIFLLLSMMFVLVSCSGGGGSNPGPYPYPTATPGPFPTATPGPIPVDKVNSFINLLNNRYLFDSSYYVVKRPENTATEGFVVVYSPDSGYVAYDLANYHLGDTWSSYSNNAEYLPVYIHGTSYDTYTNETLYFGDAYANSYYGSIYKGEFVFDETSESGKDLEKASALIEAHKASRMGEALASEFGLSEERGMRIAKLVKDWQKVAKSRSMTVQDANVFSKELLGVEMKKAEDAIVKHLQGDESQVKELLRRAAQVNGTTPEHMNEILTQVFTAN